MRRFLAFLLPVVAAAVGCAAPSVPAPAGPVLVLGPGMRADGRLSVPPNVHGRLRLRNFGPGQVDWGARVAGGGISRGDGGILDRPVDGSPREAFLAIGRDSPAEVTIVIETYGDEGATVGYGATGAAGAAIEWTITTVAK